jgi:4-diphosphocytidyl-2-C-methyl-D-erythritol kinase
MLKYLAPAKINLVLEVLAKRKDGYHEIRSLMQTVSLCDVLSFELAEEISLECTEPSLQTSDNLVAKAAELLKEVTDCQKGVKIRLEKRIPMGAGLGGGSSDAATTLLALNQLWELGLAISDLAQLAARLGSDVPFFIYKGTALVEGRGEKVTPLPSVTGWFVLLVPPLPEMPQKTKQLFAQLRKQHFSKGGFVSKALEKLSEDRQASFSLLFNVFDKVAFAAFPGLEAWWKRFEKAGAGHIHLAGSGPAIFAPMDSEAKARDLYSRLSQQRLEAYAVSTIMT